MTAYIFWAIIYALAEGGEAKVVLANVFRGAYHMWFIPAIIGVYFCIPFLQKIAETRYVLNYYLLIALAFGFVLPYIFQLLKDFGGITDSSIVVAAENFVSSMNPYGISNYAVYFMLGYFFSTKEISKCHRCFIYLLGILGFILTVLLNTSVSMRMGYPVNNYQDSFAINVLFTSIAVFVWIKYHCLHANRIRMVLRSVSQYSFGAYLLHVAIMGSMESRFGITSLAFPQIIAIPLMGVIVFLISMTMSAILNHIPIIKEYIV